MLSSKILLPDEILAVLRDLKRRCKRSLNNRRNRIIFRLACCCGLRCCEIYGLNLGDVLTIGPRPVIHVRKDITKGEAGERRSREIPLWWDKGTLDDIAAWKEYRLAIGADLTEPFVCAVSGKSAGARLTRGGLFFRWRSAIAVLGEGRVRQLSIHKGRHSFCSHALHAGHSLVEVRDAAGHANISTTSIYAHLLERAVIHDIFGERLAAKEPTDAQVQSEV